MPIAAEIAALLPGIQAQPQMHQRPLAELRQTRERIQAIDHQPVAAVEDRVIDWQGLQVPVRLYAPVDDAQAVLPLVLVMHGGGFVFGGIDGYYDHVCRVLCMRAHSRVMSVGYRLAPEQPFPAATDDCYAALEWAVAHAGALGVDAQRVFVAGGSAGANLAAVTALRARDALGPALRGQVLFYPILAPAHPPTPSALAFAQGYYLTLADVQWFWQQYLTPRLAVDHPYVYPLLATQLAGLPPALVITAEYDPLRDEGEHYALRLQGAGVPTTLTRYDGMVHGFMAFPTRMAALALHQGADWMALQAGDRGG